MRITYEGCDICRGHAPEKTVRTYIVSDGNSKSRVTLCEQDAEPMLKVLKSAGHPLEVVKKRARMVKVDPAKVAV